MHGPTLPTNPLHAAARETMAVAREAKSPLFERGAVVTMLAAAAVTTAVGALQAWHMLKRDLDDKHRDKDKERDRPRERDDDRRWTRREEEPQAMHTEAAHRDR